MKERISKKLGGDLVQSLIASYVRDDWDIHMAVTASLEIMFENYILV